MSSIKSLIGELVGGIQTEVPDAPEAEFVVEPESVEVAARLLDVASEHGLVVLPWGGGTHQGMGGRIDPDMIVSTGGMTEIEAWEPDDLTVVVGAGCTVAALEERVAEAGQSAVLPELPGTATVGGVVAAGVSGWRRTRYGPTRDRVLQVTMATGDGRVVRGGGGVVKNVSGYDLPRLAAGSFGALGVITGLCFKLWPAGEAAATIQTEDPESAGSEVHRPLSILGTERGSFVYLAGTPSAVEAQASRVEGEIRPGLHWPDPLSGEVVLALRMPASATAEGVHRLPDGSRYVAAYGVGEVGVAMDRATAIAWIPDARRWAEAAGGALVVTSAPTGFDEELDPWGSPPQTLDLQRRIKAAFDPLGIMVPGRLPGGL